MATIGQRKWSFASGEYGAIEGDFNFKLNSFPSYGQEIVAGLFGYTTGSNQYCEMSMQWMMSPPGGSPGPGVVVLFFGATSATGDGLNSYAWSVPNGYGANNLLFYRRFSFDINKAYRLKLQVDFDAGAERQYSAWIVDLSSGAATQVCTLRAPIATGNFTNTVGQFHDVRNTISSCSSVFPSRVLMSNPRVNNQGGMNTGGVTITDAATLNGVCANSTWVHELSWDHLDSGFGVPNPYSTEAPVADFTIDNSSPYIGDAITVNSTSTGSIVRYDWVVDTVGTYTNSTASRQFTMLSLGTKNITLTVTDNLNRTSSKVRQVTVQARASVAPVASFRIVSTPTAGIPLTFFDNSTNVPTSWYWDFGDGTTSTEQNPSKTYYTIGTYRVNLTATNSAGTSSYGADISVVANTGGGGGAVSGTTVQAESGVLTSNYPSDIYALHNITESAGYTGTGHLGYWGQTGEKVTWSYTPATAGTYNITFRYHTPETGSTRTLWVNGTQVSTVTFTKNANSWGDGTWSNTAAATITLNSGSNTIELRHAGSNYSGYIDLDSFTATLGTASNDTGGGGSGSGGSTGGGGGSTGGGSTGGGSTTIPGGVLPTNLRIMTLGDSITQGTSYQYAYRQKLNQLLSAVSGRTYTFVGSQNDGTFRHEGHSGWAIDPDFLNNYENWLTNTPADLVIINGGVNGLGWGQYPGWQSLTDVQTDMQQLVDGILTKFPSTYIIIQTVANDGGPAPQFIPYNTWIRDFVTQSQGQGKKVYLADTATITTGFADQVHPAQAAYEQFGQIIFNTINPLLTSSGGGSGSTTTTAFSIATNPTYTFAATGTYNVRLVVKDSQGLSSETTKQITVSDTPGSGGSPGASVKVEAETATLVTSYPTDPYALRVVTENPGYTGTGYLGYWGLIDHDAEWTYSANRAGKHTISFRWRTPQGGSRTLWVNGTQVATLSFAKNANAWSDNTWSESTPTEITLNAGSNKIELRYSGPDHEYVDIDSFTIVEPATIVNATGTLSTSLQSAYVAGSGGSNPDSTVQNPTHVFRAPGTYTVTLTATNSKGSGTTTRQITVKVPYIEPVTGTSLSALDSAQASVQSSTRVNGTLSRSSGPATAQFSGTLSIPGSSTILLGSATTGFVGAEIMGGSLASTLGEATTVASGFSGTFGTAASTLAGVTAEVIGRMGDATGTLLSALDDSTMSGIGYLPVSGTATSALDNVVTTTTATVDRRGKPNHFRAFRKR